MCSVLITDHGITDPCKVECTETRIRTTYVKKHGTTDE